MRLNLNGAHTLTHARIQNNLLNTRAAKLNRTRLAKKKVHQDEE